MLTLYSQYVRRMTWEAKRKKEKKKTTRVFLFCYLKLIFRLNPVRAISVKLKILWNSILTFSIELQKKKKMKKKLCHKMSLSEFSLFLLLSLLSFTPNFVCWMPIRASDSRFLPCIEFIFRCSTVYLKSKIEHI